jgi:hypothetical protein
MLAPLLFEATNFLSKSYRQQWQTINMHSCHQSRGPNTSIGPKTKKNRERLIKIANPIS